MRYGVTLSGFSLPRNCQTRDYTAIQAISQRFLEKTGSLGHPVAHFPAADDMKMQVRNGLAGIRAAVGDHPEPV